MSSPIAKWKFARVVIKQRKRLLAKAVRICRNPSQADDLVQDSLWDAYDGLHRLRSLEENVVMSYLVMTMKNKFVDMCRRKKCELFEPGPYIVEPTQQSPEETMEEWRFVADETL